MKKIILLLSAIALFANFSTKSIDVGADKRLPNFLFYESFAVLYEKPTEKSQQIATLPENKNNDHTILTVSEKKDEQNVMWYKCYYAKKNITGWTKQVNFNSYYDFAYNEVAVQQLVAFYQTLAQAYLEFGSSASQAKRLLGKPISEETRTVGEGAATYVDGEFIHEETTLEFNGITLVYAGTLMQSAFVDKPGLSFGGIICNDKRCDREFVLKKFHLDGKYTNKEKDKKSKYYGMEYIRTIDGIKNLTIWINSNNLVEAVQYMEYIEVSDGEEGVALQQTIKSIRE